MRKLLLFLLFCALTKTMYAQERPSVEPSKNAIYASFGSVLFLNSAQLTYDRLLAKSEAGFFKSYYLTFKGGGEAALDFSGNGRGSGYLMSAGVTGLTGKRKNHFELGLGIGYFIESNRFSGQNQGNLYPTIAIGYRKQTSNGFLFRTGIGVAEWLYLGFGYSF